MGMWHSGRRNVYELDAWQKVDAFATLLHDTCQGLDLDHDKEWLTYLLTQVSRLMRQAVEEGWNREYLAECILSLSEALTLLALVDYYLVFLRHEGYLSVARAEELTRKLSDVQDALTTLAGRLRAALRSRPEDPLASSPWSRN